MPIPDSMLDWNEKRISRLENFIDEQIKLIQCLIDQITDSNERIILLENLNKLKDEENKLKSQYHRLY